jgi:hypothetical protein
MTGVGISVLIICVVAFAEGQTRQGETGLLLGIGIVAINEWALWRRRSP